MSKQYNPEDRILNCIPSPDVEKDWTFSNLVQAGLFDPKAAVPKTKDLREKWWKIGDQKDTGSCVGWAAADSVMRWHFVKAGKIGQDDLLSVRFIWMGAKETDEWTYRPTTFIEHAGTFLKAALEVASKYGNVLNPHLSFEPSGVFRGDIPIFYTLAANLRIAMYHNLGTDQKVWRTWLANEGPILTRVDVDQTWMKATDTAGNLDEYLSDTAQGGHAIALVGYTEDRFIVRNSWGTYWGDQGFAYASHAYAKAAFMEAYGVRV
ncbi:MAG: C1 family peptidase [Pseudomonadota bacterium]